MNVPYEALVEQNPLLRRGEVQCRICKKITDVDSEKMVNAWNKVLPTVLKFIADNPINYYPELRGFDEANPPKIIKKPTSI